MSVEVEIAEMRKDLEHILERLDARDMQDTIRDKRQDQLFEMFTFGKNVSSFVIKFCIGVGTLITGAVFVWKELWPLIR
jgi:hypothetical protein